MKITTVTIINYRGIDALTIQFKTNFTIIYGENGNGKSSIISAINDLLGMVNNDLQKQKIDRAVFSNSRIKDAKKDSLIRIDFDTGAAIELRRSIGIISSEKDKDDKNDRKDRKDKKCSTAKEIKLDNGSILSYDKIEEFDFYSLLPGRTIPNLQSIANNEQNDNNENIAENINANIITLKLERLPLFVHARGIRNYHALQKEIVNLINIENRDRLKVLDHGEDDKKYRNETLELIRRSLAMLLTDFQGISFAIVNENQGENSEPRSVLTINKGGVDLTLDDQLSSGEAYVVMLICIICLNITKKKGSKAHIICIDELEASLHPRWQISLCKVLQDIFKDVQFIVTSYSPFIWSSVNKDNICILENIDGRIVANTNVSTAKGEFLENIVANYFKILPYDEDIAEQVHDIEDLFAHKKIKDAKESINKMREEYGNIQILDNIETKIRLFG